MVQICCTVFAFALLVVIQSVSSLLEDNIGELHFTIPDEAKNFDDAVYWCKTSYISTLAVVNNTYTQTALQQFLDSKVMTPNSTMFINIRLIKETTETWYLISGTNYSGQIGNQNTKDYLLYCHLTNADTYYTVTASTPEEKRYYICQYDENRCSSDSARNIVYMGKCHVKYDNESLTWYQARERCVNSGGNLATFQSEPSNSWISPKQFNSSWLSSSSTYWVGIRYKNWSWKYTYEDNEEAIFTSWSNKKPNNYSYGCVCVDPNGSPSWSWTDCDCSMQRQFVCLKKVAIQTTTVITTTTINPTTTAGMKDIITNSVTRLITTTDSNGTISAAQTDSKTKTIALAVGIGGGGLIILIILIVVLVVIFKRRQRRDKGSEGSTSEMQGVVEDTDKPENNGGVYAAVVPNGKHQGKTTDPRSEIIYTSPEFTKELNSKGHTNSSYEDANSVKDPDVISTFRGQTRSIFPQGFTDLYANADEVPKSID